MLSTLESLEAEVAQTLDRLQVAHEERGRAIQALADLLYVVDQNDPMVDDMATEVGRATRNARGVIEKHRREHPE